MLSDGMIKSDAGETLAAPGMTLAELSATSARAAGPRGEVAIKILKRPRHAPADAVPRFGRDIAALRKLKDVAGVLPLIDADPGPAGSAQPWFVMPLAVVLRKKLGPGAMLRDICEACRDLATALSRVHDNQVTHRDIKPDNLYWYNDQWCLGDFGLADFPEAEDLTESGRKLGPAYYIAPEMLNSAGSADGRRADVYSLGKTIECVSDHLVP